MLDQSVFRVVQNELTEANFTLSLHKEVFCSMLCLYASGSEINSRTVTNFLRDLNKIEHYGGYAAIVDLLYSVRGEKVIDLIELLTKRKL